MDAFSWQIALVTVAIPTLITAGLPALSKWVDGRRERVRSDADIGAQLRDELRADNEVLRQRISVLDYENSELKVRVARLEEENGVHVGRITRLEKALRDHGHHDFLEGLA